MDTKKIKFFGHTLLLGAALAFVACSDDDDATDNRTPLATPTAESVTVKPTATTLAFAWQSVDNATQYGYRLYDSDGEIVDGSNVTTGNEASFSSLKSNATYTFELSPFAQLVGGTYSNATPLTMEVKTDTLGVPVLTSTVSKQEIIVSWEAVDEATQYYVTLEGSDGSVSHDTISADPLSFAFTASSGVTYSVSVSAVSAVGSVSTAAQLTDLQEQGEVLIKVCDVTYATDSRFANVTGSAIYRVDGEEAFRWVNFLGSGVDMKFKVDTSHYTGATFDPDNIQLLKGDIVPLSNYSQDDYGYHFVNTIGSDDYVTWTPEGQTDAVTSFYFYGYYSGSYSFIDFSTGTYDCGYGYFWSSYVNEAGYENTYFYLYY